MGWEDIYIYILFELKHVHKSSIVYERYTYILISIKKIVLVIELLSISKT